jgi:hypothetical protein
MMPVPKGFSGKDQRNRWLPGTSGNPHGRPRKNVRLADIERAYLSMTPGNFVAWLIRRSRHSDRAKRCLLGMWRPESKYKVPRWSWRNYL